jgi:hypothetical protein
VEAVQANLAVDKECRCERQLPPVLGKHGPTNTGSGRLTATHFAESSAVIHMEAQISNVYISVVASLGALERCSAE